jgi:hypothetical protein
MSHRGNNSSTLSPNISTTHHHPLVTTAPHSRTDTRTLQKDTVASTHPPPCCTSATNSKALNTC